MFKSKKNIIGLDIGSSSIKLVELKENKKGFELVNFGMVPLPAEAIIDCALINSSAVVEAIRELLNTLKVKSKYVATSVSGHSVIIKKISLPVMTEQELEESIHWEAEQYIPFDINEVNIDVQILNADESGVGQMEVLLVAAKTDLITDYTSVISEAGLTPLIIDVDVFAIENMFELNYSDIELDTLVIANIGASMINLNIMTRGINAFTRDINIGGNQFTEEIQKQLNLSYEEAEALKIGSSSINGPESEELANILSSVSETLASEIQRSLDFYAATSLGEQIQKIYLSGGTAKISGLSSIIESKVGVPVELLNPFRHIHYNEKSFDFLENVAPFAAVAVGLALRYNGDKKSGV